MPVSLRLWRMWWEVFHAYNLFLKFSKLGRIMCPWWPHVGFPPCVHFSSGPVLILFWPRRSGIASLKLIVCRILQNMKYCDTPWESSPPGVCRLGLWAITCHGPFNTQFLFHNFLTCRMRTVRGIQWTNPRPASPAVGRRQGEEQSWWVCWVQPVWGRLRNLTGFLCWPKSGHLWASFEEILLSTSPQTLLSLTFILSKSRRSSLLWSLTITWFYLCNRWGREESPKSYQTWPGAQNNQ